MNIILAIAALCHLSNGAYNNGVDYSEKLQRDCHKYYANCMSGFVDKLGVVSEERLLKCMREKK